MRNLAAIVLGLIFLALAAVITAILFGWTGPVLNLVQNITANVAYSLLAVVGCLVLAVLAFSIVTVRPTEQVTVMTSSKFGQINISDRTIADIVTRVGLQVEGIKELTPRVLPAPEGINIGIQVVMNPDQVIPEVVEHLQGQVKAEVEKYTGLKVAEVKVMVQGIESTAAIRIR